MSFTTPTRTTVLASFARRFPSASAEFAGELFDRAFSWACDKAELRYSSVDVTLEAGTREYDLDAGVLRVESVEYWTSATSYQKLRSISREELESQFAGWRTGTGTPTTYYVDSVASTGNLSKTVIGLRENPTVSTSGSYPKLTVRCQFVDTLSGSDVLPPILRDESAILAKMYAMYVLDEQPGLFATYNAAAEQAARDLISRVQEFGDESPVVLMAGAQFAPRRRR